MIKSEFYEMYGSGFNSLCIGSERDPQKHAQMRKALQPAFTTKAVLEQESIVQASVDDFLATLSQIGDTVSGLNMTKWFEMLAFDIVGEMAFGESFHCIENRKPHFWSDLIVEHLFFITVLDNLQRFPLLKAMGTKILPRLTTSVRDKHSGFSREKIARRLENRFSRKDFMDYLVNKVDSGDMEKEELTAHASTIIIAGGETVATFLSAATYYLLQNPEVYQKVKDEIRSRYASVNQIDATSAQQLPYLRAYISESMRIYPPASQGFPRLSSGTTINGVYIPPGVEVYTSAWTITHDEKYFHDPFTFKPERWLDPNCEDVKEASQPFSLGPRGCIGKNFAYMEICLILAKMHYNFDLELMDKGLDWEAQSRIHMMWWKPKLPVRFTPATGKM
ncbi:cytochrome P450 [Penicillium sp. IBT 18751x]|nr:cytochrome P450 [Penicillium sp. IBT 18751x]